MLIDLSDKIIEILWIHKTQTMNKIKNFNVYDKFIVDNMI